MIDVSAIRGGGAAGSLDLRGAWLARGVGPHGAPMTDVSTIRGG
jgi:hypothetical protein